MIFDFIHETKNVKNIKYIDLKDNKTHDYYLQSDKDYKKYYEKIKDDYDGEIAIDAKTNELVGYVFIKNKKSGEEGFISPLFVVKKYRGFGIGKILLNHAINKYNAVDLVVDKDNTIAFSIYKKHGFVIIGDGNNKDQYWMKLKSKLSKDDTVITETKRSELPDSAFGIPEDRKYPLHDKEHVESAIRLFGHAEESKKKSLAKRIKIAADRYGIEIKPITQVYKYLNESYINESWVNDLDAIIEFNKKLNNMEYIIVTKNKKVITQIKAKDFDNYETLNPSEFIKYNGGICWDYVMYEAYAFSKYFRNIKYKTFFVCNYNKKSNPTHTFLLFYLNNKCYWFESSWKSHIGIYKFNSESCALSYITKTLYSDLSKDQLPVYEVFVREYNALDNNLINISGYEYMNYMDKLDDYKFNKTSICEPEYIYDAKKFFYHESYINENKKYEDIYDAIINGLIKYDQDPKVGKKDEKIFKNTGKSSDDDFGNKLCICNLKGDYYKICQKLNKELKPLGAKLSPDNYGTAFVHLNEQTQTERFYEVLKKKLEEDNNDEYINESFVRINIDRSELTEEMLIDAANKCAHYTKWCKMDDSSFCCVNELNSFSVNVNDATFCFATFNGDEELLSRVLKCCNENNSSRYGKFEVFAKENEHGVWLCGRMTELYTYKEVNESYITEGENMFIENNLFNKQDIYYNKDKFDSGEINLCFITGHSGSGKSTMGRNMQSDNIEHYELDDLQCIKDHFTMSNLKEYGDLIYSYFNGQGKRFYITYKELVDNKIPGKEYEDILYKDFVHYAMKYANMHRDKKYVIEGVWLFCGDKNKKPYFEPSEFKDYAFYIKGTSMIISKHRGALRDAKEDNNTKLGTAKSYVNNFFRKNWKWYFIDEKQINKFRKYFSNLQRSTNESYVNEACINETSMRSKFNDSFEKKGNIKLSSFNKVTIDKQFVDKYKGKFKLLKHVDLNDDKRIAFLDNDNNLVGYIATNKEKDGLIWITALEVSNQYKGYGLGKQLLDYGVKHLGAQALGVAHDNEVAIKMYEKYGFKISKESIDEVKRKENLNYRMYIGSAVNEAEQLEVPDSYNNNDTQSVVELLDNTDPKRIFLSSDWHFYSLKYKKEKNAVNTREIVSWCKNNIKDTDVFMYLGDMCFRWASDEDNKKVQEIFKSLPGIKILILGNHDIVAGEDFYLNCGFDYVLDELVWHDYIFTHKPINISNMNYVANIHAHKH